MTPLEERLLNPAPGGAIAAARDFGIDLTLVLGRLRRTPEERFQDLEGAMAFFKGIRERRDTVMIKLREALRLLANQEVDFVIAGGVAAGIHGSSAVTLDLDVCYSRDPENLRRLVTALAPTNPRLRGAPADLPFLWDEQTLRNGFHFTLTTDVGDLDLLGDLAGVGDFQHVKAAAAPKDLFGQRFAVLSLDALIASKRAAGRAKDLNVIPELEALREASS